MKTDIPLPKVSPKSLIVGVDLPKDTEIYLTSADLFEAPLTANLIKDHFDYILLQKISNPIEYLKTSRASLFNFGQNYSKDQIEDMVKFTLATINPKKTEHALPDGTTAPNLVLDPTLWSFEKISDEPEAYRIADNALDTALYLGQYNGNWVLTNGESLESLLSGERITTTEDTCLLSGKPYSRINISYYKKIMTVDFYSNNCNLMNICLH
jgi:hypothetical protein